jgi:hypothetical protein
MDYKFFLNSFINIIINPVKAWETIDSENRPIKLVRNSFFFPLILLVSISAFAGSLLYVNSKMPAVYSLFVSIKCFILFFFVTYASAFIVKEITYPLDLGRDFRISFRLIVFSMTPFLICQVMSRLFESLIFVNLIGLYGLYIFWVGAEKILNPPQYKKMPLLIASILSITGIFVVSDFILTKLTDRIYYAFFL